MAPSSPSTTIPDETAQLHTLIGLLKQEQGFLVSADTDGLNGLMQQKSQSIAQMTQLAQLRHAALGVAGCEAGDAGMDAWLAKPGNAGAVSAWRQMLALAVQAKEFNRVNGMLIAKQMANNELLIDAMRTPATAPEAGGVYGPKGQTTPVLSTRRVVVG